MIATELYHAPCGDLLLGSYGDQLCLCDWVDAPHHERILRRISRELRAKSSQVSFSDVALTNGGSPTTHAAARQLDAYFTGTLKTFDLPLLTVGTPFQQAVWKQLQRIAWGETRSYLWLAQQLQRPTAARAIGAAVGANALSILIPCHRIVSTNHHLTGYAGGILAKAFLLALESTTTLPSFSNTLPLNVEEMR